MGFVGLTNGMCMGLLLCLSSAEPFLFLFAMGRAQSVVSAAAASGVPAATLLRNHAADASTSCSSNSTHVGWICDDGNAVHMAKDEARSKMTEYLWENIMPYDVPNARAIGFDPDGGVAVSYDGGDTFNSDGHLQSISRGMKEKTTVDGLSDGVLNQTLFYSLQAKTLYPWTDVIPRSIYMEYVVPYAVVNEPRSDHRPLLFHALKDMLKDYERTTEDQTKMKLRRVPVLQTPQTQIKEVVKLINTRLWSALGRESKPIVFQAGLTPRIYDPLSVVAYGHSSCTGLAVLLVSALRSVGIPARMAGTPAWNGNVDKGNHSWVEVFVPGHGDGGGEWIFLEPTPGIAEGDEDTENADDLDRDPCKRWFCTAERFDGSTEVFATRLNKEDADVKYPMAWAVGDGGVPGVDRSQYYTDVCGTCA